MALAGHTCGTSRVCAPLRLSQARCDTVTYFIESLWIWTLLLYTNDAICTKV